ncbi:MAG: hypothetical protein IKB46_03100, partial [Paludibacteraceae bacterium]|nr:hypothetical protein [Paludibacteraceae bacterium]
NYILVAEAVVVDSKNMFITAKLLDVETARTIMTDNLMMGTSADAIQEGCMVLAKKLFHEEVKKEVILVSDNDEAKVETLSFEDKLVRHTKQEQKLLGMKKYSYGATQMDEKAFRIFLQKNNRQAYLKYMQSNQMIYAGWGLLGGGTLLWVTGTIICCKTRWWIVSQLGIPMCTIGGSATIAGVPLLCVGHTRQKNAIKMFNEQNSAQEPALSLNLQASQNGIGLALSF